MTFDSKKEAERGQELQLLQRAGKISDLKRQEKFPFVLCSPGKRVIEVSHYTADYAYLEGGQQVVEDVKSPVTRDDEAYKIRKKLMLACYDIEIREV